MQINVVILVCEHMKFQHESESTRGMQTSAKSHNNMVIPELFC